VVASLVHSPYAILAHSAGALAAARFITNTRAPIPAAILNAFVWVDLDALVAASIPPSLMSGSGLSGSRDSAESTAVAVSSQTSRRRRSSFEGPRASGADQNEVQHYR